MESIRVATEWFYHFDRDAAVLVLGQYTDIRFRLNCGRETK